ncbi:hypothetical protein CLOSAC_08080 [Clostridium saccharobutylicum]|uniref:Uncharacterized protein n=1 Tax=Clostridium saccharobutylicum TaxID=169679 RepID=A0A1S8NJC2_CLOSA|nr:hypothetical protein CLOSAC_08080 [Clostridium saccharobutylicum]
MPNEYDNKFLLLVSSIIVGVKRKGLQFLNL